MQERHGLPLRSFAAGKLAAARAAPSSGEACRARGEAYLRGAPLGIELPLEAPQRSAGDWHRVEVPARLEVAGSRSGHRLWLAAYLVLLGRYGSEEVCLGFAEDAPFQGLPVLRSAYVAEESAGERLARLDRELQEARHALFGDEPEPGPFETSGLAERCSAWVAGSRDALADSGWLALVLSEEGTRAHLALRGASSADLARMAGHLALLASGLSRGDGPVGRLDWLSPAEKAELLALRGDPAEAPPVGLVHRLFEEQAARTPETCALRAADRSLTYAELDRASAALASHLRAQGVGPEQRVGVCLQRNSAMPIALLAVLRAGGCYVPLDPAYPDERIAYMLADSDCLLVLVDDATRQRIDDLGYVTLSNRPEPLSEAAPLRPARIDAASLAYIIYTSGSTGRPKGVAIEHGSAHAFLLWARATFATEEWRGVLAATSVCFDLSIFELFGTLACGGTVHLVENLFALADYPRREDITLINSVPSVCAALLALTPLPRSVHTVNLAGEPLPGYLAGRIRRFEQVKRLLNLYGPSEDTTYSTCYELPEAGAEGQGGETEPSIGRPLPGTTVQVLDAFGAPVPLGVPGELYLGGVGLARGYFGKPEQTRERFAWREVFPGHGERLYRTGDRVKMRASGLLEHLGRLDDQVKFNGFRIELGEIASRLVGYPGVGEAIAALTPDAAGLRRLVAYFVADRQLDSRELSEHLSAALPHYMLPSLFVQLPSLPKTLNGKVDRKSLPTPAASLSAPPSAQADSADPIEREVRDAWEAVLGSPPSPGQGFYAAGGDSLRAVHLLARLRHRLRRVIPLQAFATGEASVEALSALARTAPEEVPAESGRAPEPRLSLAEQRLWIAQQLAPTDTSYNLQARLQVRGTTLDALRGALTVVLERHTALRRRVEMTGSGPRTWLMPVDAVPVESLAAQPSAMADARFRALAEHAAAVPFDLGREAPTRITLLPRQDSATLDILLSVHHYAFDDLSLVILSRDLLTLLEGGSLPVPLATPESVAAWEATERESGRLDAVAERWARDLAPALGNLRARPLPAPAGERARAGRSLALPVSRHAFEACQQVAERASSSLFSTAIAAFGHILAEAEGVAEVLAGVALAGRPRLEMQGLVACCVNLLPLLVRLDPRQTRLRAIRDVSDGLLDLLAHQDVPLEALNDALRRADPGRQGVPIRVACGAHNGRLGSLNGARCHIEAGFIPSATARLDLTLWLEDGPYGWTAAWTYACDRFEEAQVRHLHERWEQRLLANAQQTQERVRA